jgi:hypothetical protein
MTNLIENPNSSGQGYCADHIASLLHWEAVRFGYAYSHSVPITRMDGSKFIHHCYKYGEHNVSFSILPGDRDPWSTSTSCASGRQFTGIGIVALVKHLTSKRRRYPELRG